MEITLLVILGLAIPVCAIAGFFMALGLRTRAALIERRLAQLEARLAEIGPLPAMVPASPLPDARPQASEAQAPAAPPLPEATAASVDQPPESTPPQPPRTTPPLPLPDRPGPKPGFEETLGTRWTVWVGGVALALGGLFLVRYSIEQGLLGPGARVAAGAVFAAAMIAAGEWLRRRETAPALPGLSSAHVPGVLTAAGASTAFATAYAAYALYGLIGPGAAFVLLGLIAILTMVAAALHGPALAALGLVAALGSPLLVASQEPQPWAVVGYVAFVVIAAYGVARLRLWRPLALAAAVGAIAWVVLLLLGGRPDAMPVMTHVAVQIALAGVFLIADPHRHARDAEARPDRFSGAILLAFALSAVLVTLFAPLGSGRPAFAALCALMMLGLAVRFAPAAPGAAWAALIAVGTLAVWPVAREAAGEPWSVVPDLISAPRPRAVETFLTFASALPLAIAAASLWRVARGRTLPLPTASWFAAAATVGPLAALVVAYWRVAALDPSLSFALVAGALALAFVSAAAWLRRQEGVDGGAVGLTVGATASAAVAALALGLTFALDKGMLTVAFALAALGTAWVSDRLRIPALRFVVGAIGALVLGRLVWDPTVAGGDPGRTLIVNWLLWGYGVPAAAFYASARLLERTGRDRVVRLVESLAIVFAAFLVFFEIRHALHDGDPLAEPSGHLDMGLIATASLLFSLVMVRMETARPDVVYRVASLAFGAVSLLASAIGLGFAENPLFTGEPIWGGAVFNSLIPAYLMPAVLAAALAWLARRPRPRWYVLTAAGLALALQLLYTVLAIRRAFQGPVVDLARATGQGELWAYSVALLLIGVVLLAAGLLWNLRLARLVSAGYLVAAVLKVFVVDLANLQGVTRALSFIGLGLALVGIGFAYQKLLAARPLPTAADPAT